MASGWTLASVLESLEEIGAEVIDTVAVIKKVGGENKAKDAGYGIKTLINVDVVDGEVVIVDENGD